MHRLRVSSIFVIYVIFLFINYKSSVSVRDGFFICFLPKYYGSHYLPHAEKFLAKLHRTAYAVTCAGGASKVSDG